MQQFNFNLQRQLANNLLIEAGYVGARGVKIPMQFQINQLPDQYLALARLSHEGFRGDY